jgi:hypothetical protein
VRRERERERFRNYPSRGQVMDERRRRSLSLRRRRIYSYSMILWRAGQRTLFGRKI